MRTDRPAFTPATGSSLRRTLLQVGLACGIGGVLVGGLLYGLTSTLWSRTPAPAPRFAPAAGTEPLVFHRAANDRTVRDCRPARADVGKLHRLDFDTAPQFTSRATRIDFERRADGTPLRPGESVEHAYTPLGLELSTSIGTSFVGANSYVVAGRSLGNSAATVSPVWEGVMTLRFHVPGLPKRPATVRAFGLWIAHVFPDGTKLEAIDAHGSVVGEIATRCLGTDFLGFQSDVPIAAVRVVPNLAIDPNFTVDDLVFTPPVN